MHRWQGLLHGGNWANSPAMCTWNYSYVSTRNSQSRVDLQGVFHVIQIPKYKSIVFLISVNLIKGDINHNRSYIVCPDVPTLWLYPSVGNTSLPSLAWRIMCRYQLTEKNVLRTVMLVYGGYTRQDPGLNMMDHHSQIWTSYPTMLCAIRKYLQPANTKLNQLPRSWHQRWQCPWHSTSHI